MKLSVDFAFEGFRIIRQKPQVILAWGVLALVLNGLATVALMSLGGDAFRQLAAITPSSDPTAALAIYAQLAPAYAVMLPLTVLLQAILSCAVYRVSLGKEASGFGALRIGGDEFRQVIVGILFFLIFIGLEIGCVLVGGLIGGILGFILGIIAKPLAAVGIFAGIGLGIGVLLWVLVRLSLASVQSFDQKRINMFGSWQLTKGNAGAIFVGYVIAGVMALLVAMLCIGVFSAIAIVTSGGNLSILQHLGAMGQDALRDPIFLIYTGVMNLLVMPLLMAISIGAPAAAYKALSGNVAAADSVF